MITISGDLVSDTVWAAETYYFTASCNTAGHKLTFDLASGDIICKFQGGDKQIIANGANDITTDNSDSGNEVIFTSVNDDAHGEAVPGSSGSPVKGDQSVSYITTTVKGCTLTIENGEAWYCENNMKGVLCWGDQPLGLGVNNAIFKNFKLKHCGISSGGSNTPCLLGLYRRTGFGNIVIENFQIDDTNTIDSSTVNCSAIRFLRSNSWSMNNVSIYPSGSCLSLLYFQSATSGIHVCDWKNIYLKYPGSGPVGTVAVYIAALAGGNATTNIENMFLDGFNKSTSGLSILVSGDAPFTVNVKNSLFKNCNLGIDRHEDTPTLTMTEDYDRFWNNNINSDAALGSHSLEADPQTANLPVGCIIDSDCPFPNGLAIGNLTDYEKQGSDTFDNLSIDESLYSATGYQYQGSDKVTPGINYELTNFAPYPSPVSAQGKIPFSLIGGCTITFTGQLTFNPNNSTALWLQNPYF